MTEAADSPARMIKKYPNRRLYDTEDSRYITQSDLADMIKQRQNVVVLDAKTNEDITRSVLGQVMLEEEGRSGDAALLPAGLLRQLMGYYGDSLQSIVPQYLETSMKALEQNQERLRTCLQTTFGQTPFCKTMENIFSVSTMLEQVSKQNIAMFEQSLRLLATPPVAGSDEAVVAGCAALSTPCAEEKGCAGEPSSTASSSPSTFLKPVPTPAPAPVEAVPTSAAENLAPLAAGLLSAADARVAAAAEALASAAFAFGSSKAAKEPAPEVNAAPTPVPDVSAPPAPNPIVAPTVTLVPDAKAVVASAPLPSPLAAALDMQQKIVALQRQLADMAKGRSSGT